MTPPADLELLLILFADTYQAQIALDELQALEKERKFCCLNAASLQKDRSGRMSFDETHDLQSTGGAIFGAVVGALLGMIGGPAGAVIGGAAGAATGGALAGMVDLGFSNKMLHELTQALKPGTSLLLVLLEEPWNQVLASRAARWNGRVFRHLLKSDIVVRLTRGLDDE